MVVVYLVAGELSEVSDQVVLMANDTEIAVTKNDIQAGLLEGIQKQSDC